MKESALSQAGAAFVWRAAQLGGLKLIFLIRLLILARLLAPDDFGLLTIAASAVGILMSLTNFGMVEALVQGREVDENRYNAAWTFEVSRALLVGAGVFISAPLVAAIFSAPRAVDLIRALALWPVLDALASIKMAGLTRELHFRPLAALKLTEALANTILSIVLALRFGVWGLVGGALAGSAANLILSYIVAPHRPRWVVDRQLIRPLLRFGRWIYFAGLIAMIGGNVLRIAISRELGAAGLGLYYLAAQIAFLPAEVASEVVGSVAFPLYARLQTSIRLAAQTFRTVFSSMAALLFPLCALLIVLAPTLVAEVLGPKWAGSAPIIRVLALVTAISLFGEATGPMFRGLGQPYRMTATDFVQYALLAILVWGLAGRFGVVGAAAAWLPAVAASQLLGALFMTRMFERPFAGLKGPILAVALAAAAGAAAAFAVDRLATGPVGLVIAGATGALFTLACLWLLNWRFSLGFGRDLALFFPQLARRLGFATAEPTSA